MKVPEPQGFEYPPCTYNFKLIEDTITQDIQLIQTGKPSEVTLDLLIKFQDKSALKHTYVQIF